MKELRELFPITEDMVYLNCAATSPLALPVKHAIEKCGHDQFGRSNLEFFDEWRECEQRVRAKLARLVGASPDEPKSSSVATNPIPNSRAQKRLTATRAVSGFSGLTIHFASARRLAGIASSRGGSEFGVLADTCCSLVRNSPRAKTLVGRPRCSGRSTSTGTDVDLISARRCCSSAS